MTEARTAIAWMPSWPKLPNSAAVDGAAFGNVGQLGIQAIAVLASVTYSAVMTFVILKVINVFVPLRVNEKEEVLGLDASQHREAAYQI